MGYAWALVAFVVASFAGPAGGFVRRRSAAVVALVAAAAVVGLLAASFVVVPRTRSPDWHIEAFVAYSEDAAA